MDYVALLQHMEEIQSPDAKAKPNLTVTDEGNPKASLIYNGQWYTFVLIDRNKDAISVAAEMREHLASLD